MIPLSIDGEPNSEHGVKIGRFSDYFWILYSVPSVKLGVAFRKL